MKKLIHLIKVRLLLWRYDNAVRGSRNYSRTPHERKCSTLLACSLRDKITTLRLAESIRTSR